MPFLYGLDLQTHVKNVLMNLLSPLYRVNGPAKETHADPELEPVKYIILTLKLNSKKYILTPKSRQRNILCS